LIEAPAGLLDSDTPEEGARREGLEEAVVTLNGLELVSECHLSPGAVTERMSLYLGACDSTAPRAGGQFHAGEDIESFEVGLEQALEMVKAGHVIDAKTIVLIQAAGL
jgi:8-oxo-dGTP pyrophosphatase MutT (NUDIX family)